MLNRSRMPCTKELNLKESKVRAVLKDSSLQLETIYDQLIE
jgi:hypothetical protein